MGHHTALRCTRTQSSTQLVHMLWYLIIDEHTVLIMAYHRTRGPQDHGRRDKYGWNMEKRGRQEGSRSHLPPTLVEEQWNEGEKGHNGNEGLQEAILADVQTPAPLALIVCAEKA